MVRRKFPVRVSSERSYAARFEQIGGNLDLSRYEIPANFPDSREKGSQLTASSPTSLAFSLSSLGSSNAHAMEAILTTVAPGLDWR
jgi:hypothetical protein